MKTANLSNYKFGIIEIFNGLERIIYLCESFDDAIERIKHLNENIKIYNLNDIYVKEHNGIYLIKKSENYYELIHLIEICDKLKKKYNILKSWKIIEINFDLLSNNNNNIVNNNTLNNHNNIANDIVNKSNQLYLSFKKFTLNKLNLTSSILIIGKEKSGKTTLCSNILNQFNSKFIKNSLIISYGEEITNYFKNKYPKINPKSNILHYFNENKIKNYIVKNINNHGSIILDDCIADDNCPFTNKIVNNILSFNKVLMVTVPFPIKFNHHFDYIMLLGNKDINFKKKLYDMYGHCFPNFQQFCINFDYLTNGYDCMVIDNNTNNNNSNSNSSNNDKIYSFHTEII